MPLNHSSEFSQLTDQHFQAIGKIVVEWSNIEYLLEFILRRLLFTDFLGQGFTERMSVTQISGALNDALNIHQHRYNGSIVTNETISEIRKIKKEIEKLRENRNQIAHLCWMRSNDKKIFGTKFATNFSPHNKKEVSIEVSLSELDEWYKKSHEMVERLQIIAYYHLPAFNDERVQKMLHFENSSLKAGGLEEMVRVRFQTRVYNFFMKRGKNS